VEPVRGLSWPSCLSGGAASLERTSRVIRHGSDPGCQVGGRHASREVGAPGRVWFRNQGSSLRGLVGRPILGPVNLLGFPLHELGSSGIPGLHPRQLV